MIRLIGTAFAALFGLIFGSFLNVCISRWPVGESIAKGRSHCCHCDHSIPWFENIPLLSFLFLAGRCRKCKHQIGLRYPLVELLLGLLWGYSAWQIHLGAFDTDLTKIVFYNAIMVFVGKLLFYWLVLALACLDWENLWLPDWLTLPGIAIGFGVTVLSVFMLGDWGAFVAPPYGNMTGFIADTLLGIGGAALLVLLIRWIYFLIRRREGIGLGDAKLMALLAAWMGLPMALLSFAIGVILAAFAGIFILASSRRSPQDSSNPANASHLAKLPLGTFLCIGGIFAHLWGIRILAMYLQLFSL
jgi:leader peptidase (prepilin peptidase)/N-methyltransferase